MQNRKPHRQKAPQTGHSIFGTILFSLLAVLAVEILLLTFAAHATRLGPQLNQNAEDILAMQVDNRSRYLQSIFHDAQELTSLSDTINGLTQQLLDEGEISLSTLDSSSDAAYPLLEAAAPELISTLRIKSVTGVFLILNTHDLDKRKQDSRLPAIYLRDLDPDAAPSQRNADLTFVRAPAQLVQSLSIATDNSWSPTIRYRALGNRGFLYPPFQAAYKDGASLAASDYGHWTSRSYLVPGDTHEAIAYSQPLILPDGTVYGVIGVELLADYLWENLPCSELQNNGTYFLAVTGTEELSASELQLRPVLRSHCDGQPGSADESLTLRLHSAQTRRYLFSDALYIASVSPLNLYSRNAPFSGEHWLLVGSVPAVQLFAFAQRLQQRLLLTAQVDAERDLRKRLFAAVEHHRGRLRMKSGYGPFVLRAENGRTLQYAERIALGGSGGGQQRQYRQEKGLHHRQIDFSNNTIDSLSSTQVIATGI